jgi:signal transduction histidine kinase
LARRIYLAFLAAAVVPTAIAGLIGISVSLDTLRTQTLVSLRQEVTARAAGVQLFFDQVAAELRFLADMSNVGALFDAIDEGIDKRRIELSAVIEQDFVRLSALHPHVYQMRVLDARGHERVRVEKRGDRLEVVPAERLQDKSDRYYVREALTRRKGDLYVSPLDLNEEFGKIEVPDRPVVRVATVVADRDGRTRGLIIVNLHAQVLLDPLQEMVRSREGVAYLFDRSGHYLFRSAGHQSGSAMQPVGTLAAQFGVKAMTELLGSDAGTVRTALSIVAHAPVEFGTAYAGSDRSRWVMALAFPERVLWQSVVNLYVLYAVLLVALAVTALGGYTLSRRLLGPLEDLKREADVVAGGDFTRHVRVTGRDEIADLGQSFNAMADRLAALYRDLEAHRARLSDDVASRTRELASERALLASVFRHAGDAILAVDASGSVTLANTAARALFGLDAASPASPASTLDDQWPQWRSLVADVAAGETLRRDVLLGSKVLAVSVDVSPDDGQRHTHVIVARDVSEERGLQDERRQLDRQLFQIEKMTTMGELAMGIAHEIGNPLAGMKAVVQALQYEDDLPQAMLEPLRRLDAEIDRLAGFLHSFHGFAASTALDLQTVSLPTLIEDVLFWTGKEARSQRVSVDVDIAPDLPALRADAPQLKQVLLNLVMNALHAMPDGGRLQLIGRRGAQGVQIEVVDNGMGIAAEVIQRIFDPFFTTRPGGSGLGLAITAKIVREHGATIHVESTAGQGARFVLVWPTA